ncbi:MULTISPECIES: FAD-dependent monooxygenase [Marinomonas]|uniref:FAD-dependent monooxygenase n=1 Tax=Marinomonas arctica TaxID=383750 RepID=A0A7H1J3Y3_9GAMM|nr:MULTISPECIES: FAD-dependent monooxygenase [Marinomonas]QNT05199.1 FAD-dependent monooxygenase [Marinomonas arctica]GGN15324.1 monooxygenase [Marinomonas arctica]
MDQLGRVVIAGAGIGGLCAALALSKQGIQVLVCEQATTLSEVGAGLQISPNALKVLRHLGLEEELRPFAFVPQHAAIRDYRTGDYYLKSPLGAFAQERYGAPYWHLHRADLHRVLVDACLQAGVELVLNSTVLGYREHVAQQQVSIDLADGRELTAGLLIGADGIRSNIREHMLGPESPRFMGQVAWRGVIPVSDLTVDVKPDACVWAGPGRHFVSYYLRGGDYVNFVAVEERSDWQSESWREEGDVEALQRAFSGWHPEVSGLLKSAHSTFLWALNGREELPTWHKGRVVLLGDACHPMLPFMAQGAAMAIEDGYVLAKCLSRHSLKDALLQYEQSRKPRATKIQQMSKANAGLYHMHGGMLGRMKLTALQAAGRFVPTVIQAKLDAVYGYDVTKD